MKYYMIIGAVSSGKTSLTQRLCSEAVAYRKTQSIELRGNAIDTPGEYTENRRMMHALTVMGADADCILFAQDATADGVWFSPAQASMFARPVIGVVTKTDLASPRQLHWAEGVLTLAGAKQIFKVSSVTGEGIRALRDCLARYLTE